MMSDDEFIREYEPFVRSVVTRTRSQLMLECEVDDLMGYAYEGLLRARERFDPERGVKFKSFAYYRVRGALLDGVRSMAYLPRRAYARLKAAEATDLVAEPMGEARHNAQQPAPSDAESTLRAIDGVLGRVAAAYCTASAAQDEREQVSNEDPEAAVLADERGSRARQAIAALPEQERFLIQGHYIEGRRFDELAAELGLSKSWASRLHSRALGRMREALSEVQ
ncbi:MAG: sigma-70 family RNA polymerase sigma factor [Myxococcales bacterium]|jgi:RNA polymerase sigma factor for flagellar operon FliA